MTGLRRRVQTLADTLAPAARPDGELCAAWHARRDELAFAELVRRHGRLVWGVCRRAGPDPDDSYQAVFLLLARRAGRLSGRGSVAPWLYLTAVRVGRRAARAAGRRQTHERLAAKPEAVAVAEAADWRPAFDAAVAGLPAKYREAVVLCELGGLPRAEAAARLRLPVGTLASRLAAARLLLRKRLARRGVTAGAVVAVGTPPAVTAGVASAAAQQLMRGWTTMAALKLLAGGAVAAGLVAVAVAGRPAADPPPPAADWKAEFRKAYGLADGQVLRRVPPPYPAVRGRFYRGLLERRIETGIPLDMHYSLFHWRDGWVTDDTRIMAPVMKEGVPLGNFLAFLTGVPQVEQRIDPALRDRRVTGEFVVRDGADPAAVLAALGVILRDECKLPVTLRAETTERDVYVVSGRYDPRMLGGRTGPLPKEGQTRPDTVFVFANYRPARGSEDDRMGLVGAGGLRNFLAALAAHLGYPIADEIQGDVPNYLFWRFQVRLNPCRDPAKGLDEWAEDRDPAVVLPNVAAQTGLTFTRQKRAVRELVAEPAK